MTLTAPALFRYAGPPTVPGYAVDEFLGRGATGVVWAATRRESGERVALKLMEADDVDGVDRSVAEREVALGRRVTGAHLARAVEHALLDDGCLVLVMVLADGGSLRDVVAVRGAVPLGELVTALTPMATALAELHEAGVVHADVAPGNRSLHDGRSADARRPVLGLARGRRVAGAFPRHVGVHRARSGARPPPGAGERRVVARRVALVRADRRLDAAGLGRRPALAAGDGGARRPGRRRGLRRRDRNGRRRHSGGRTRARSAGDPDACRASRRAAVGGGGGAGALPGGGARAGRSRRASPRPGSGHHHEDPA